MKVLNIKKATPMSGGIITTCDRYTDEESTHMGILDTTKLNQIKDIQKVVSAGEQAIARGIKNDTTILLDFKRYARTKQKLNSIKSDIDENYDSVISYQMPVILLDSGEHLLLDVSDITLIVDDFEYIVEGDLEVTSNDLILS